MKKIHLWNFIHSHLEQNNSIILTAVVSHEKGSPGKTGFKMALSSSGDLVGSIGGGVMEYNILKKSKELLRKNIKINKLEKLHHNKKSSVSKSGLICSGSQTNFTISLSKEDIKTVKKILDSLNSKNIGKIIFSKGGIVFRKIKDKNKQPVFRIKNENDWTYEESTGERDTVLVIGGGHVGLAVCRIMSMLDFHVIVYDSRDDLHTIKENKYADRKIIDSYKNIGKILTADSYVVIVTTGFESDKEALVQVLKKNVKYAGLMGTKAKIKKIFNEVVKAGFKKELLKKVHAPIGIDINSDTPEEIAVSIAAEIIREKNKLPS